MMLDDLLRLLTLQDGATRTVLLGSGLLGVCAGVVGALAVLRKRALLGDALAHTALPGVCVAYLVVGGRGFAALLLGALVFGLIGVACIVLVRAYTRVKEDAAIGIVLASFFGLGIVLSQRISKQPGGDRAGLDGFIFGKAASMVRGDVLVIGAVAVITLGAVWALYKEFRLLCFDSAFGSSQGWPMVTIDLVLMALLCACTVAGLPAVGVVLMAALLIIPGVSARCWSSRLGTVLIIAGAIGGFAGVLGAALSAVLPAPGGLARAGWPTGPLVTLSASACFLVSVLFAPERGVVAAWARRRSVARRISLQNLLRRLYEAREVGGRALESAATEGAMRGTVRRAVAGGLVLSDDAGYRLTDAGVKQAEGVVRAHRLWELFLISSAGVATDHVDRDADEVEHHLPPELLARLEAQLASEGRLPGAVPRSPHELALSRASAGGVAGVAGGRG
ncbi:MAG: metal ABC transporter permease [Phycisphaerales bacterium]